MATTQTDSTVTNVIKNLCRSYGWSYGVFWSFDQSNSIFHGSGYQENDRTNSLISLVWDESTCQHHHIMLLTMQDAYFEDHIQGLIDDLLLQSPMFGGGLIGQAALTKRHQWISSKDNYMGQSSSGSIWDMFQDDSKLFRQFSSGIETIAAIPVEPQGVVQFGSTNKVVENTEFINHTKKIFNEIVNGNAPTCSSSSPKGMFSSLKSSEDHYSINQTSFGFPQQSFSSGSQSQSMFLDHNQSTSLTSFKEPLQDMFDLPMDLGSMDEFFQTGDFNISQWYPQSPTLSNVTINDQLLSQATGFLPINYDKQVNPLTISGVDVDLFGNTGDLGDIVTPVINGNHLGNNSYNSGSMSVSQTTQSIDNDSAALPPKKGLFSNLGIKELFEGVSSNSTSCVEDQVSSCSKGRKTGTPIWEMGSLQPAVYNKSFGQKSEPLFKSDPWSGDGYSIDGSSTVVQAKKQVEPTKPTKKKAKPGTRPRPKDRQMILDRMAELRELIPNGEKMSIDCLLDRTIKHMLFLQSVTKHADRIKQVDESKHFGVTQNNYLKDPSNNGVTVACELGNQSMICPLIVEDLSTPGQMLIEMICEEHGLFLEIVDIIRGFGLTILKGFMETREDKIWARFIVEAEAKRHVTRHEIFAALVQLLQTMGSNDNHLDKNIMQTGNSLLNDFHHPEMQLPVSLADTRYHVL